MGIGRKFLVLPKAMIYIHTMKFFIRFVPHVALCAYLLLVLFGAYHHEPWRDEALVWNIAREDSIATIFDNVKHSGNAVLWFLTLVPFAKTGFPYITTGIVHAAIATTGVFLFLFYSKFSWVTKIFFIFSYYMAYEYAILARNYVVGIVLLFTIATMYPIRFRRAVPVAICIALLFHVNIYSWGPAIGLLMLFVFELIYKRKLTVWNIVAIAIMIFGCLSFIALLLPKSYAFPEVPLDHFMQIRLTLRDTVIPFFEFNPLSPQASELLSTISILSMIIFLFAFVILNLRRLKILFLLVVMLGWHVYMNAFSHLGSLRHHGLLLVYIIFLWWIRGRSVEKQWEKISNGICVVILNMLLFVSIFFAAYMYHWDYTYPFSGTTDMSSYLKVNNITKHPIVSYVAPQSEGIVAYLPSTYFWYPEYEKFGYFELSDYRYVEISKDLLLIDVFARIYKHFPHNEQYYLLLSFPIPEFVQNDYTLVHTSQAKRLWGSGESFWLYKNKR